MTKEEAIKTIKIAVAEVEWNYPMDYAIAFETAISALEKQIPKKPFLYSFSESHDTYTYFKCPNLCDTFCEVKNNMNFCPNCGQALDFNSNGSDTE